MEEAEVNSTIHLLRNRLASYRSARNPEDVSVHLSSIDIAIGLIEFGLKRKRPISIEEEVWFNAGYTLDMLYRNSEWADIVDKYYELVEFAKTMDFFRPLANADL